MLSQAEKWLLEEKYNGEKTKGFFTDLKRLKAGEPLGYVIGHVPFLGCKIYLDSKPLIPRVETEFWVEKAIEAVVEAGEASPHPLEILDLCAGSGAIGVAVAKAIPRSNITFGEIEKKLLATIAKNLEANEIPCTRYKVFQSDLFANIDGKFDLILCNPPYVDPVIDRTESTVKNFEPHLALYGREEGLELIKKIIAEAPYNLNKNGQLWLEHEPEQTRKINELANENDFQCFTDKDQYHIERYSVLMLQ